VAFPAATAPVPENPPPCASDRGPIRVSPRRSRWHAWLWVLAILVAVRLVLASVLAPLAAKSLSRVLGTRVDVGDVSFAPIDAIVTLRDVVVHAPDEGPDAADAKPVITADRVRIDVQWLPLLHHSLVLRQLALEAAHVDLERLRGAGWTLERFQRLDPTTELPQGWSFALDRIALRDTQLRPGDVGTGDVGPLDVSVRDARVSIRRRRPSAFGRAPNLRVDAVVDGGRLLIIGSSDPRDDGVAIDALVRLKDAPLDRFAAYRPAFMGSSIAGQVSGRLHYQRDPGRRDRLTGQIRGRHIAVHVPAIAEPALAIRRVEAGVDGIDLLQRRVTIGTLMLYGARLAIRPDLVAPVPLLDGLTLAPHRASGATPRRAAWSWTIGHLESPFARLIVPGAGDGGSLAANVSGESIGPGAYWSPLRAWIGWDGGTAVFDGTAHMTHGFTLQGRLTANDMDAVAVARALGPPLATLVQAGRGAADLNVDLALGDDKGPPLDVQGKISVADLWLAGPDPDAFAVGAGAVDLELTRIVPAKDGSDPRPAEVAFASAVVTSPYVKLTRTLEGWSADAATRAAESQPDGAAAAVMLTVADVRVRNGRLLIADETANPNLVVDLAAVDGSARALRLPAVGLGEFVLQGTDRRLGALRLAGARGWGELQAELSAPAVSLAAVTPYLQRARLPYAFTGGTGAVRSRLSFAGDRWSADTTLTLVDPTLGGDESMLAQSLGMASGAAFTALRERHGEISLQLPLESSGWAGGVGLNEKVAGAVREALARPRLSAPIQIAFVAGRADLSPLGDRQLAAVAEVLVARPGVVVELRGAISRADRRWFAEQSVAAQVADKPSGFKGWLRAVGVRDQRTRIHDALVARSAGQPGQLDAADEAALSALVADAPPIPDDRLATLAAARSTLVANLLADRYGVIAIRVLVAEATAPESATAPTIVARFLPRREVELW
jgi:hypothetical protein